MAEFIAHKVVASLPSPLEPNTIYAVRVGAGFDLYVSDMTGAVAHKLNGGVSDKPLATVDDLAYWRETMTARQALYVQSRGQGLVSNGSGLMGDNTNFSRFVYDGSDLLAGFGSFKTDAVNFNGAIDEFIAVNPSKSYEFSFYAKTLAQGTNNKAYAFIECFDIDKQSIQPHNLPVVSFRITKNVNHDHPTLHIHPDDVAVVSELYQRYKASSASFYLNSHAYTAKTGYRYPNGTYSRTHYTGVVKWSATTFSDITGVWGGVPISRGVELNAGDTVSLAITGGTYIYPIVQSMLTSGQVSHITGQLGDHVIPAEWTAYGVKFDAKKLLRPATALIKVGWLLNRGSRKDGNVTAVNLVEFGET